MSSTTTKRPRSSEDDDEWFNSSKRLNASQSSTQPSIDDDLSTIYTNGDDDPSLFELDLSMCPELSSVDEKMSDLNIGGSLPVNEEGDEMQKAAIAHATSGGNLFLTGKAG